jgi:hypothetical protein
VAAGNPALASHLIELRTALDQARSQLGFAALVYTDAVITPGATTIKAVQHMEVRIGTQ